MSVAILLVAISASAQDRDYNSLLDDYQVLCEKCLDLKIRMASGSKVSRVEAKELIGAFLAMNKEIKLLESSMTVVQRRRFDSIGKWFSTGQKVEEEDVLLPCLPDIKSSAYYKYPPSAAIKSMGVDENKPSIYRAKDKFSLLASVAAPDMAYGVMGVYRRNLWGVWANVRTNFVSVIPSYSCTLDGYADFGAKIWPNGNSIKSNLSACAGALYTIKDWLAVYAGLGYGQRKLAWQDVNGEWALVSDWSVKGLAAETGFLFSLNMLVFTTGVSTINFQTATFTCGVGVSF